MAERNNLPGYHQTSPAFLLETGLPIRTRRIWLTVAWRTNSFVLVWRFRVHIRSR